MAEHNNVGKIGEDVASTYLITKGLVIIERNYSKKWGEIDIICRDSVGITHFVEVKSTSRSYTCTTTSPLVGASIDDWQPEEMIHNNKIKRLRRVIQTYIMGHNVDEWVFDVMVVYLNKQTRMARCKYIEDIVL